MSSFRGLHFTRGNLFLLLFEEECRFISRTADCIIECFSCAAVFSLPVLTAVPVLSPVRCFSMQASHERDYKNDRKFLSKR